MVRRSVRNTFLATCLLALGVSCSQQSSEQSQVAEAPAKAEQAKESKLAVNQDDLQILDVVLVDLFDFKEFDPMVGVRTGKTEILLHAKSAGGSSLLSEGQLLGESFGNPEHAIPGTLGNDLRKRNAKGELPLTGFKPSDQRIVVRDLSELSDNRSFSDESLHALGYVVAWFPGYAEDGRTAVFRASFGPTPHWATLTYLLAEKDGRWTVVWRKTSYYA